jgi:hypothetical protein
MNTLPNKIHTVCVWHIFPQGGVGVLMGNECGIECIILLIYN